MKTQTVAERDTSNEVVYLKFDEFEKLCNARGWTNDHRRAKELGLKSHTTIRRLRKDAGNPGGKFIGLALAKLGVNFEVIFGRRPA